MDADAVGRPPARRALVLARSLLAPYLVLLGLVVFLPAREAGRVTGVVAMAAEFLAAFGVPREPAVVVLEFLANVALFVPFGVLVPIAFPDVAGPVVLLSGFLLSVGIELVQIAIPSRVPAVSDVVANTIGAGAGLILVRLRVPRRERAAGPDERGRQ